MNSAPSPVRFIPDNQVSLGRALSSPPRFGSGKPSPPDAVNSESVFRAVVALRSHRGRMTRPRLGPERTMFYRWRHPLQGVDPKHGRDCHLDGLQNPPDRAIVTVPLGVSTVRWRAPHFKA